MCNPLKIKTKLLDSVINKDNTVINKDNTGTNKMTRRKLGQVDLDTGEVLEEGFIAYIAPKRQNAFGGWIAMAQNMMEVVAKSDLTGNDF